MIVLGIETSGRSGSVAVVREQQVLKENELSATGRRHARTLVPEIGELLTKLQMTLQDVDAVAVSVGPGSFTGLRVGVTCAKTLAYSLQKPLLAVDTFLAVAERFSQEVGSLWLIDDALRGDVCAGFYRRNSAGEWQGIQDPQLLPVVEFRAGLNADDLVSGPGVSRMEDELVGIRLAAPELRLPQASQIALVGERRLKRGEVDDFWSVEPHYMRRSAAEEKAEIAP